MHKYYGTCMHILYIWFLYTSIVLGRRGGVSWEGVLHVYYHALFCLLDDRIFGMPGFLPTKISVQMVGHGMD